MKTQISYKKLDGDNGVALVNGEVSSTLQAKRELAQKLDAPAVDEPHGEGEISTHGFATLELILVQCSIYIYPNSNTQKPASFSAGGLRGAQR